MPNYTENYNLKKPLPEEFYNIEDHNGNMDIIDRTLKELSEESGVVIGDTEPETGDVWIDTSDDNGDGEEEKDSYSKKETDNLMTSHTHTAEKIYGGTFAGTMRANATFQSPASMLIRNSSLVSAETTPTVNGEICWVYE